MADLFKYLVMAALVCTAVVALLALVQTRDDRDIERGQLHVKVARGA